MRPSEIALALGYMLDAKRPVMLHGPVGAGKSEVVAQVAKSRSEDLLDTRLSQLDPVDLRGVPSINAKLKQTNWNTPDFLPTSGKGILFFDEINSAATATQAAAYQLVLDRKLGSYTMPDGWNIVAAGNRATDRALVNQMSTALKNRFVHLNYEVNNDDWCDWALRNDVDVSVLGFIRWRPTCLMEFEPRNDSKEEQSRVRRVRDANAFGTPRTWKFVSDAVKQTPPSSIEFSLYAGIVGEALATEFMAYMKYYRNLPNLDALLMNPMKAEVPKEPSILYALATGLAAKATPDNIERVLQYAGRIQPEFQVLLVKDAIVRDAKIASTKAFVAWTIKNKDVSL